jgi:hypothetical protein
MKTLTVFTRLVRIFLLLFALGLLVLAIQRGLRSSEVLAFWLLAGLALAAANWFIPDLLLHLARRKASRIDVDALNARITKATLLTVDEANFLARALRAARR